MGEKRREGGCGCGHVRYRVEGEPIFVNNCHCRLCQQQTGSTSVVNAFFETERVTVSAGVPTIWMGILQALDANPGGWDLSAMRTMTVGGAAPPRAMIEAFGERHGLHITHGWGMTEMSPIGTISGIPGQERGLDTSAAYDKRAQQGPPIPFVEVRARKQGSLGSALESVGIAKQRRIVRATRHYLMCHPRAQSRRIRFDVVAFDGIDTEDPQITWVRNAFDAA